VELPQLHGQFNKGSTSLMESAGNGSTLETEIHQRVQG